MLAWGFRILRVVSQSVELVIAHDGQGGPFFGHGSDDLKRLTDLRSSVDEVAEENHLAFGMPVFALGLVVAQGSEQMYQFIGVAVNITDQIVHDGILEPCQGLGFFDINSP